MRYVVDTNIIMSAMLSPSGRVADVFFNRLIEAELICPHFLVIELFDKKERIQKYSKLNNIAVSDLYYLLLKRVSFINEELISTESLKIAYDLVVEKDIDDLVFVALAVHANATLWTGDLKLLKHLRKKGFTKACTTTELYQETS